ncbi:MAG: M12 family metallo-peptidase [Polyangia bacterium]
MTLTLSLAGCAGGQFSTGSDSSNSQGLRQELEHKFRSFDVMRLDAAALADSIKVNHSLTLISESSAYELVLEPRNMRSARYYAEDTAADGTHRVDVPAPTLYKGTVRGQIGSQVRLSVGPDGIEGYFTVSGKRTYVQPAVRYANSAIAGDAVLYRDGAYIAGGSLDSDTVPALLTLGSEQVATAEAATVNQFHVLEIATESDYSWVTQKGGADAANAAAARILNMVEGVYEDELGITIDIVYQHTWTTPDSYNPTSTDTLIKDVRSYWNAVLPKSAIPRDAVHMFTNQASAHNAGLGYVGVVCQNPSDGDASYGVSGFVGDANGAWEPLQFMLTAHEIGHNLGAQHVEADAGCGNTVMNATLTDTAAFVFCPASRTTVQGYVTQYGACLAVRTIESCTPQTCASQGKNCGAVADGCGNTLDCGGCSAGQTCGGSGTANVCGGSSAPPAVYQEQWGANGDRPLAANLLGGGTDELTVFRASDGIWYTHELGDVAGARYSSWGYASDVTVTADFEGAGYDQLGQFRDGIWYVFDLVSGQTSARNWGQAGDIPVAGNFRGAGADLAVYRPTDGKLYVTSYASQGVVQIAVGYGAVEHVFAGSFLGDGKDEVALYGAGQWTIVDVASGNVRAASWGQNGDSAVPGRYFSGSKMALGVFRGDGNLYALELDGASTTLTFGASTDIPLAGDFLGEGKDQLAMWRPSTGTWFIKR